MGSNANNDSHVLTTKVSSVYDFMSFMLFHEILYWNCYDIFLPASVEFKNACQVANFYVTLLFEDNLDLHELKA